MSPPLFSIIIPCKNAGSTIGKTLASIRSQTFQEIELIVIDGASADSTSEVVAKFPNTVTRFLSEPDNGVYSAMNKGVGLSTGEWLLFLGANDELSAPDVLQRVGDSVRNVRGGAVCGEANYTDGRVWKAPVAPEVRYRNFMHHQSSFYHRSLFDQRLYDESLRIQADYDFNLKLWCDGIRPMPLGVRVSTCASGGLSDAGHWRNYREEINVRHRYFPFPRCVLWDAGSIARFIRKSIVRFRANGHSR